ncbi:oligosaccharide flippase family protein, partial [candidate division KSB1 bacterium]|nr:oligosaccharide flippase family protein [candidate division KSB1 bacterium]
KESERHLFSSLLKLFRQSAIYGIGHILSRSIGFLLLPLHTNYLVPDEYAVYVYGFAFIPFISIFYSAGINAAQIRYFVDATDDEEKKAVFNSSFWTTLGISLVLSALMILFANPLSQLVFGEGQHTNLLYLSCIILIFDALNLLLFNVLRAEEKPVQFVLFSIFNISINIVLNYVLIVVYNQGIRGIFVASICAAVITLVGLAVLLKKYFAPKFSKKMSTRLIKFGLPIIPSLLGMVLLTVSDRFIIRELMGDEAAGLYGAGYKLGLVMSLIVTAFRYAWHPYHLSTVKEDENAAEIFSKVLTYFIFLCCAVFLVISLYIDEIVRISIFGVSMFGEQYWSATNIVPVIMASYIFYGIYLIFQVGIYQRNKTQYLAITAGLSAALNIAANFFLIPHLGLMGAALATLIGYAFMAVSLYFYTRNLYPVEYEWLRISKLFVVTFLLYIAGVYSYAGKPAPFNMLLILAYFVVLYFIGFFEKNELSKLKSIFSR